MFPVLHCTPTCHILLTLFTFAWAVSFTAESRAASILELPGLGPDYWLLTQTIEEPVARRINNSGTVVGSSGTNPRLVGEGTAIRWENGVAQVLPRFPDAAPGGVNFSASDINEAGVIVGFSAYPAPLNPYAPHAAKWVDGSVIDLGVLPGHDYSSASAINEGGVVVGSSRVGGPLSGELVPVRWSEAGQITPLGYLATQAPNLILEGKVNHTRGLASGINTQGRVVGYTEVPDFDYPLERLPAYWDDVSAMPLALAPGYSIGTAVGINDAGRIIGSVALLTPSVRGSRAVAWADVNSVPQLLDVPPEMLSSYVSGVNELGQMVGGAANGDDFFNGPEKLALLWNPDGTYVDLTPYLQEAFPGDYEFRLTDINDLGQITGYAWGKPYNGSGEGMNGVAFIMTVPEPTSLPLLAFGALAFLARSRRDLTQRP